jgi:Cdc6-like AAA superfamily ATPase
LDAFGADSFGHGDFVRELAGMLDQARTPANIALFGAWGSGKSSIANLLREELPTDESQVRLVAFDASKYAEAPLRRHFISQVARGLNITDDRYHRGLYTGVETRDVKFRPGEWSKLTGAFLLAVVLTLAILLTIAAVVAALSAGSFESNWSSILKDYLLATLPVAAVITAFIKLAADGFHIKTTRSAPSGDEEFERLFKDLVAEAKTQRLVIFIDELDRCSPEQVASTLETLKTFLFVEGCVFIVAADQQVLEQALRRKARQHTPEDTSNPYYSAGSSYLDKVFQYQLTLPPLRAPALTRFALGLVHDSPGVWQRVPTLDEAVSVLIPTHVVSPRRV